MIVAFMTSVLYQNVHGLRDLEVCILYFVSIVANTTTVTTIDDNDNNISWANQSKSYDFLLFFSFHSRTMFNTQSYHLPLSEPSKIMANPNDASHKLRAMNEVVDILSSPSWSTVNAAVVKNNDQRKDIVTDYLLKQRHIHEFSVTGTPKPATTNLNDIFITVKTTKLYHDTRLALIIKTWFQLAKDQVSVIFFFCSCYLLFF